MGYFRNFRKIGYDLEGNGIRQTLTNLTSSVAISSALIDNAAFYSYVGINDGERMEQLSHRVYGTTDYYWTFLLINKNLKNIWNDWPKSNAQIFEYSSYKYPGVAVLVNTQDLYTTNTSGVTTSKFNIGDEVHTGNVVSGVGVVTNIYANQGYIEVLPNYYCKDPKNSSYEGSAVDCKLSGGKWIQCALKDNELTTLVNTTTGHNITANSIVNHHDAPHHYVDLDTSNIVSSHTPVSKTPVSNLEYEEWMNDNNRQIRIIKPEYISDIVKEFNHEISKA